MDDKAASSSGSLTLEDWERFTDEAYTNDPRGMTLIAPNKEIAKLWAKQYPGVTIVLSAKNLPSHNKPKSTEKTK